MSLPETKQLPDYEVKKMPLSQLNDNPRNPRVIKDTALKGLVSSIEEFGLIEPIIWNKRTGYIVGGHQRCKALKAAGYTEAQVLVVDYPEDKEMMANISLNNPHIQGEFINDLAANLLEGLEASFPDLSRELAFHDLWSDLTGTEFKKNGLTDQDDAPDMPKKAVTKLGDHWILGDHHLFCGDSLDKQSVLILLGDQKADMVFTDPPYNIDYGNIKHPKFKVRPIENDKMIPAAWLEFSARVAAIIKESTDGCIYVCHAPGPDGRAMATMLDGALHASTTIIWVKDIFTLGRGKYQNQYEPIWFGWSKDGSAFSDRRDLANVWHIARPKRSIDHPTMKPVDLVVSAISHASNRGGMVLDLFGGSGTTMIAAEQCDRRSALIELDPRYCDVIVERWQNFTGKKARLHK